MSSTRSFLLPVLCGLLLTPGIEANPDRPAKEISADWLRTVTEEIRRTEYHYSADPDGEWSAPNRKQALRSRLDMDGLELVHRIAGADLATGGFAFRLRLTGYGRSGSLAPVEPVPPLADENRVEFAHRELIEWYVNDERGLEQGFTIDRPPVGKPGSPLILEMRVDTELRAYPSEDRLSVTFRAPGGTAVLRYAGLLVRDALGRAIDAWLEVDSGILRIAVDDGRAVYPIVVDPLMTTPDWVFQQNIANNNLGFSVTTAGDVNGDGYSDVLVGGFGVAGPGEAFLYYGSASGPSNTPAWTSFGDNPGGSFAWSVSTAGDVNDDGFDDVIIGQPFSIPGRASVYYGSASGLAASSDWHVDGVPGANSHVGLSVGWAGDVNGDGYDDVIVGAPNTFNSPTGGRGAAYVFFGGSAGLGSSGGVALADWTATCHLDPCDLGKSVATAGDVDGDGYDEVIIGAPRYADPQVNEGIALLWYGSASGLGLDGTMFNAGWEFDGDQTGGEVGTSVGTAGDVNGDGYADIFVGGPLIDNPTPDEGALGVFYGSATGPSAFIDWLADSGQPDAQFGSSGAIAGDVNGDGYADLIVGAPLWDATHTDEGAAFVWFGSGNGLGDDGTPANADWMKATDLGLPGEEAQMGFSVGTAGDVNGDGYSDTIVGLPYLNSGGLDAGEAHIFAGSAEGLANASKWAAQPDQNDAELGTSVASAGDVNADGYSDVIVGAPFYDNGHNNEGRAYFYKGSETGLSFSADWTAESNQTAAWFGFSVGSAGDVNGDGFGDVIVGAYFYDGAQVNDGAAFVWYGGKSGLGADGTPANANWQGGPPTPIGGEGFGYSVASAGDVNGDGLGDLIVGAPFYDNRGTNDGRVFVFHGSRSGPSLTADWDEFGPSSQDQFGISVASAGDVNGDGYSDILVGAPLANNPTTGEGRAFAYLGSKTGLQTSPHWSGESDQGNAEFGVSVASAGDINGDGYSDIIVGASGYDTATLDAGKAFVWNGSSRGLGLDGTPLNADWSAEGWDSNGQFGLSVASAGDVNGDGYSDVVVGAPLTNMFTLDDGAALVWHGSASGLGPTGTFSNEDWSDGANQLSANFGISVAGAGDVNGDGFADLLVGASTYETLDPGEGHAFAYFGNSGGGLERAPRQLRVNTDDPIHPLGNSDDDFSLRLRTAGRTAAGRGEVALEWEIEAVGVPFDGNDVGQGLFTDTGLPDPTDGSVVELTELAGGLPPATAIHWRARFASDSPYFPHSPWFSMAYNAITETDARTSGFPDADGDGHQSDVDCNDSDPLLWDAPGEVTELIFTDKVTLLWTEPSNVGGGPLTIRYDTIRSEDPADFISTVVCVESDDGPSVGATDLDEPSSAGLYAYLIRAENDCGLGDLGEQSDGLPRIVSVCP